MQHAEDGGGIVPGRVLGRKDYQLHQKKATMQLQKEGPHHPEAGPMGSNPIRVS